MNRIFSHQSSTILAAALTFLGGASAMAGTNLDGEYLTLSTLSSISLQGTGKVRASYEASVFQSGVTSCKIMSNSAGSTSLSGSFVVQVAQGSEFMAGMYTEEYMLSLGEGQSPDNLNHAVATLSCSTSDGSNLSSEGLKAALSGAFNVEIGDDDAVEVVEVSSDLQNPEGEEDKPKSVDSEIISDASVTVESAVELVTSYFTSDQLNTRLSAAEVFLLGQGYSSQEAKELSVSLARTATFDPNDSVYSQYADKSSAE